MQLGEGTADETEILDAGIWRDTHTPQFSMGDRSTHRKPFFPAKKESLTYGLGWQIGDYRGRFETIKMLMFSVTASLCVSVSALCI